VPRGRARLGRADGGGCTLAGYAGLLGFFAPATFTRRRGPASSLDAGDADRGTTRALVASYGLAVSLPIVLRRLPIPRLPRPVAPLGLVIQVSGPALRWSSMRTLGQAYARTLRVEGGQQVVQAGPDRWLRHPGASRGPGRADSPVDRRRSSRAWHDRKVSLQFGLCRHDESRTIHCSLRDIHIRIDASYLTGDRRGG
jgi:hypothetical protein